MNSWTVWKFHGNSIFSFECRRTSCLNINHNSHVYKINQKLATLSTSDLFGAERIHSIAEKFEFILEKIVSIIESQITVRTEIVLLFKNSTIKNINYFHFFHWFRFETFTIIQFYRNTNYEFIHEIINWIIYLFPFKSPYIKTKFNITVDTQQFQTFFAIFFFWTSFLMLTKFCLFVWIADFICL